MTTKTLCDSDILSTNTIAELAEAALSDADGDVEAAANALADRLIAIPEIVKRHIREWALDWSKAQIQSTLKARRQSIIRHMAAPSDAFQSALTAAVSNEYRRMMDMPLWGGLRLGDATAAQVRESALKYEAMSADMRRKASWQKIVADAVEKNSDSDTATVSETLPENTLIRLWEESSE